MNPVVVFDLRGAMAHYRRPDTLGTHASYPFIPRTTLRGLIAGILGLSPTDEADGLPAEARCGLRLLSTPRTIAQQLSLHGKTWEARSGKPSEFHRPTSIELVIAPHYRVYYAGPLCEELSKRLQQRHSTFHTYLGSAFCLTFPEWIGLRPGEPIPTGANRIACSTVVPSAAVGKLLYDDDPQYARVGGLLRDHIGGRRFRGTVSVIYEMNGKPVVFESEPDSEDKNWEFCQVAGEGVICLW